MARITISDIAKQAGVSKTAVSFAFNDPTRLPEETVQRILTIADELGYIPNPVARSLSNNRTGNIGVLFPQPIPHMLANPYNMELLRGIGLTCDRRGYNVLLVSPVLGSMRHAVSSAVVDGFLTIGLEHYRPTIELLDRRGVPYVMVDSEPLSTVACINNDDESGSYAAMSHLLERGHRRIDIIGIESGKYGRFKSYVGTLQRRISGYRAALAAYGMDIDGEQVRLIECPCTPEGGRQGFEQCWDATPPSAVVTMADVLALGLIEAARAHGVSIPEQLSVVGFDDLPITAWIYPPLTTIHQPIAEKGEYAAELLLQILTNDAAVTQHVFPTRLIERGSVIDAPGTTGS